MQKQGSPIIIFDSGIGGLSVYREVKQVLPGLDIVYCSDSEGFPYGPKPEHQVIERTSHFLTELVKQYSPSLAIIACNTASTVSLPKVRKMLDIPVVGVVPAIKTASERSANRCIGLLATPGTVQREYTDQLINNFASDCRVVKVGSADLVDIAEQHLRGESIDPTRLETIVAPFFEANPWPDTIVLGCTHFPLLRDLLQSVVPTAIDWVDSGEAIARRVCYLLGRSQAPDSNPGKDIFIHTGSFQNHHKLAPALEKMGFCNPMGFNYSSLSLCGS